MFVILGVCVAFQELMGSGKNASGFVSNVGFKTSKKSVENNKKKTKNQKQNPFIIIRRMVQLLLSNTTNPRLDEQPHFFDFWDCGNL